MFTTIFKKTTEAHTIKTTNVRDFHILENIIESTVKEARRISENNYVTKEDDKYVYGFECTKTEYESIKELINRFNRIDTIKMEAEIK
jgi:hypothetical protein